MTRFVPWVLVALCFALGVASRSISASFAVFVPALQQDFDASRSAVTVIYSFALLMGGIGAPVAGWIVDRFGLRTLTVVGMSAAALATASTATIRAKTPPPRRRRRRALVTFSPGPRAANCRALDLRRRLAAVGLRCRS